VKTLHLDLKLVKDNYVELRYFFDKPNDYNSRSLPLEEIADLIQLAEQDYYVRLHEDYAITGRKLYNWLDGSDRLLYRTMQQHPGESLVLAIFAAESLAHLPWEVLHNGNTFLVARMPAVVPVRWVSSDTKKLSVEAEPENRALQVLFMATSPLGVEPVLDFEAEEGRILEATARPEIELKVEESGCLTELGYLIDDYGKGYFDVLHLTGHANLTDDGPRFNTETETGELYRASAADIAEKLQFRLPQLIFLSGCRTGQAGKSGAVPSMAEELLDKGAKAVLGWGQSVLESDATVAAAALYGALAAGYELTEALSRTYQALIKQQARDWHLLRLYVGRTLPGNLVTPLRTRGRKPAPKPSVAERFLDPAGKVKVPTRGSFVGRRRQLQNCLRALKPPSEMVGVLIHGMGGLGKSSLAARLCDRLSEFERIVWVGRVDEPSLVNKLGAALDSRELREALQDDKEELKFRLRRVFRYLEEEAAKPFLLVLDDFEANLEPRNDGYVLQPEAANVLEALVWAIGDTYAPHRLILTCRYDFESTPLQDFYKQPLEGLRGADLRKKCNRLSAFDAKSQVDEALQSQAHRLADGNPRLLEWLNKVLLDATVDRGVILQRLEGDPVELREQVLAETLLAQIDQTLEEMLQRGLVFELPVPREALAAVCKSIPNLDKHIDRAVALGLLEVGPDQSLRVPRILPLKLPEDNESLYKQAAQVLYSLWWEEAETKTEEKLLEIHRLALSGKAEKIAIEIAKALTTQWLYTSRFRESIKTCQDTLKVVEDFSLLYRLASAEKQMGEVDNALEHYQKALNSCPLEDEKEKALIIHNLAVLKVFQGEHEEAITLFQLSLVLKERIGDFGSMPATLNGMAVLKANQGRIEEAVTLYQQSLALNESKDIADIQGKVATLQNLATLEAERGHIEEAITLFQQSLAITEGSGDVKTKAAILHNLAVLKANQGELEESIALYQKSLVLKEQIGDVQGKAATLQCLANLIAEQGQIEEAITLCQESLILQEKIGDIEGKAVTLHELGRLKAQQGQIEEATGLFNQSLDINERINNVYRKAMTLQWLGGLAAYAEEDFYTAVDYFQQSLEILQRLQSPEAENAKQMLTRLRQELVSIKANSRQIEEAQKVKNIIAQMPPRKNALHKPEKLKKGKRKEWLRLNSDAKEKDSN